jgi:hypothetical protein
VDLNDWKAAGRPWLREVGGCSIGCDGLAFLSAAGLSHCAAEANYGAVPDDFRVILKIFSICPVASGYKAGNGGRWREFRAMVKIISTY